jgi:thiol-disulfide isomerase/thioredoxin
MSKRIAIGAVALAITGLTVSVRAQTLGIGDPAPRLEVKAFIKGEPVKALEPGKVYVVEFWATWCGPCRATIPHLTELQRQRPNVTFIGVSILESDQSAVEPFVKEMGDRMSYRVALDLIPKEQGRGDGAMADSWMKAAGQDGIPSAFIINKDGKIAWIGHPMEMNKPLEKILAGDWDLKTAAEDFRRQQPPTKEEQDELARLAKDYKSAKQEDDPAKMISAIDALLGRKPDLAEKLGPVKIQLLMRLNRPEGALAFARVLERGPLGEEAGGLNTIAWGIVDPESETRPRGELLQFALTIARKADEKTEHRNAEVADTLGVAYFESGDAKRAVDAQRRAIELLEQNGEPVDPAMRARLETYQKAAKRR